MSLNEFFSMSGYGAYVWSCYGISFGVVIGLVWYLRWQLEAEIQKTRRRIQVQQMENGA